MELGSKVEEVEKEEERSKREMEIDKEGEERKRSLERPRVSIPPPDNRLLSEKSSLLSASSPWSSEHPGRRDSLVGAGCRRTDFQTCNYRLVSIIVIEQSSALGKNLRLQLTR